ncbi:eukaryotic translation initiation factor 6, putative [Cryptosporidium muris RN66]|uniref:Eukaryotic translation initiation factor 6 n=1 Tax=Cryptosporidium muris (strain RN66) TaxID=441375 RepID=B6AD63_CRYMR|nr:eukaryotic translation initiation factor 6, putative [Cryptosporidium muris RN66]EEA06067.1 eukaryotic translation initiation factor 6, putative [Cryptosporidium muris RN66]|eukprot:XP_002140416.1 eukaryotic translation initiation factor 6 [Cryptosporidium muris RN66]
MALRTAFESSSEVGVFTNLTNSYCLLAHGSSAAFTSVFEAELMDHIPIINTLIGGTRLVGRCTVGNRHGLLVSNMTSDQELQHLRNSLPDEIKVQRIEERLSALGNCIACNDYVALIHADMDKESEEIIQDILNVEVFRTTIAGHVLVGSYARFTNQGGIVHTMTSEEEMNELSALLQVPVASGTVNRGSDVISAGVVVNDWAGFVGMETTATEMAVIERMFKLGINSMFAQNQSSDTDMKLRCSLIDTLA